MSVVLNNFTCSVKAKGATWILRFWEKKISVNCPDKQVRFQFNHGGQVRFDKVKERFPGGSTTTGYFESGETTLEVWTERARDEDGYIRTVTAGVRLSLYQEGKGETELFHFHVPRQVGRALLKLGEGLTEFHDIHLTGESDVMGAVVAELYPGRV